jgi:hypothetical protein
MAFELPQVPEWRTVLKQRLHYAKTQTWKLKEVSIAGINELQALDLEQMLVYRHDLEMLAYLREAGSYWIEALCMPSTGVSARETEWWKIRQAHVQVLGWLVSKGCSDLTRTEQVVNFLNVKSADFLHSLISSAIVHNNVPLLKLIRSRGSNWFTSFSVIQLRPSLWYKEPFPLSYSALLPFEPRSILASYDAILWCTRFPVNHIGATPFDNVGTFDILAALRDECLLTGYPEEEIVTAINKLSKYRHFKWAYIQALQ